MTGKRLFQYALPFKNIIFAALVMLSIAVLAEVMGPLTAKKLIDDHILGIENHWVKTETAVHETSVLYNDNYYTKMDYVDRHAYSDTVTILQLEKTFYMIEGQVPLDGMHSIDNGKLTTVIDGLEQEYQVEMLATSDVLAFYQPEVPMIIVLIAVYFGLHVVSGIFNYGRYYLLQKAANRIIQKLRNDAFNKIQTLPISYFDHRPAGKIVARITNDTEAIRELYVAVLSNFFTGFIQIAGIYTMMFLLDKTLATIFLFVLPLMGIWMVIYRKFAAKYNHVIRSKISEINAKINESIKGMNIIQAFNQEEETYKEFKELNSTHFNYQTKLLRLDALSSHNIIGLIRNIVFVGFITYFAGTALNMHNAFTLGVMYAFVDYIIRLFNPISNMLNQLTNLERAMVAGERVFRLLDEKGTPVSDEKIPRFKGNVSFEHVYFGYDPNHYVLKDIHFEAQQGETIALVGHTGSGKSSIMNLLFRFYDCQKGAIKIDGVDIKDLPAQTIREHMAIVLQDPFLFTGTIYSNISLNNPKITREIAVRALKAVGGDTILKKLEKGIDHPVTEKGSTLSMGERQLISFARALAYNPAILILDEATSNIDTETEAMIQHAMNVVKSGRTTFIIAHRLSTIIHADKILVLDRGQIVESGTHQELMAKRGKYYQMYRLQLGLKDAG